MPNTAVDMSSWAVSACYPRRTFYPLSDGPITWNHRITMTYFRICSNRHSRSQAGFCHCTLRTISDRPEPTFARLRYSLGGDRPSQTTHHTWSWTQVHGPQLDTRNKKGGISKVTPSSWRLSFKVSHLFCTSYSRYQCKAVVKVHGVFPSNRSYSAS